jgi:Tat protein secretion system quality control protein TatD with DNase activity
VLNRADSFGVKGFIFASRTLNDTLKALTLVKTTKNSFTTLGLHPLLSTEPLAEKNIPFDCDPTQQDEAFEVYFQKMDQKLKDD